MTNHTLIIAEAGVNHNGDMQLARQLIDVAADAGADMVKFQTFNAKRLATKQAPKASYQNKATDQSESQHAMLRNLELTLDMHKELIVYCKERNIEFFSTGFDTQSVDLLVLLGVDQFKIPSGEITNLPHLRHLGAMGKPVILSTGMATLGEIEDAIDVLEKSGTDRSNITVLHCNTEYPTPMQDVNLRAMCSIRDALDVQIGYSDHTAGIEVPIAAVALGATVIEKHLTIDNTMSGPDHQASTEPDEFKAMVLAIRNIEQVMGDGVKRPSPSESKNKAVVRKSIIAATAIRSGEKFTADNLGVKRPGTGISPMRWDELMGKKASRDYQPDELIEW